MNHFKLIFVRYRPTLIFSHGNMNLLHRSASAVPVNFNMLYFQDHLKIFYHVPSEFSFFKVLFFLEFLVLFPNNWKSFQRPCHIRVCF